MSLMRVAIPFADYELDLLRKQIDKAYEVQEANDVKCEYAHPYYRRFIATIDDLLTKIPKTEIVSAPDDKDDV